MPGAFNRFKPPFLQCPFLGAPMPGQCLAKLAQLSLASIGHYVRVNAWPCLAMLQNKKAGFPAFMR
jgi:hypothetical protein